MVCPVIMARRGAMYGVLAVAAGAGLELERAGGQRSKKLDSWACEEHARRAQETEQRTLAMVVCLLEGAS